VIDWPAEWAKDEKFWREVATRTIAGAFALVLVGAPSVVYLMIAGQLSASVVIPILLGIAFVVLAIVVWWVVRKVSRAIERRSLRRAVERDAEARRPSIIPSAADLQRFVREFQAGREARGDPFGEALEDSMRPKSERIQVSEGARREMREIERRVNRGALFATAVGTSLVGVLLSLFLR
jgi:biopolymer transport protein ExbB/TolQ